MSAELIPLQVYRPDPLHIASVIVHVQPFALLAVQRWLEKMAGVEIHAVSDQGKLVVVIETLREQSILDLIDGVTTQPGVLNAALVYHEMLTEEHGPL